MAGGDVARDGGGDGLRLRRGGRGGRDGELDPLDLIASDDGDLDPGEGSSGGGGRHGRKGREGSKGFGGILRREREKEGGEIRTGLDPGLLEWGGLFMLW